LLKNILFITLPFFTEALRLWSKSLACETAANTSYRRGFRI